SSRPTALRLFGKIFRYSLASGHRLFRLWCGHGYAPFCPPGRSLLLISLALPVAQGEVLLDEVNQQAHGILSLPECRALGVAAEHLVDFGFGRTAALADHLDCGLSR